MKPVIFLCYANNEMKPLDTLTQEDNEIYNILVDRYLAGHFLIHRSSNTKVEELIKALIKFKDHIGIFLYSGHANNTKLDLNQSFANANGIAQLLENSIENEMLQLVILNGCSTEDQVKQLLELGVPAVIATSAPINDFSATLFSTTLFRYLVEEDLSLEEAFNEAIKTALTVSKNGLEENDIKRGYGFDDFPETDKPIWGLFTNNKNTLALNPIPFKEKNKINNELYIPNEKLTKELYETLKEAPEVKELHEKENKGEKVDIADKRITILKVLPYPIGLHLQRLVCPTDEKEEGFSELDPKRLKQIGNLFQVSMEFMAFIMLAQLWEFRIKGKIKDKTNGKVKSLSTHIKDKVRDYFYLSPEERDKFNYLDFITLIREYIDSDEVEATEEDYFISELSYLKDKAVTGENFRLACDFLYNLHVKSIDNKYNIEIAELCKRAEDNLCEFFKHLDFLHQEKTRILFLIYWIIKELFY